VLYSTGAAYEPLRVTKLQVNNGREIFLLTLQLSASPIGICSKESLSLLARKIRKEPVDVLTGICGVTLYPFTRYKLVCTTAMFLNRRVAVRYRTLASIIPGPRLIEKK
jgi:hypothetical protein